MSSIEQKYSTIIWHLFHGYFNDLVFECDFQGVSGNINLCNDVLQTALDVVSSLPPLSLSNESKLPPLAVATLGQVF